MGLKQRGTFEMIEGSEEAVAEEGLGPYNPLLITAQHALVPCWFCPVLHEGHWGSHDGAEQLFSPSTHQKGKGGREKKGG